jgi:hypothetical protein
MKITNHLNLPSALARAVGTEKHNAEKCLSATTLIQGTKHIILTDRYWDALEDDVSGRVWALSEARRDPVSGQAGIRVRVIRNTPKWLTKKFK